MRLLQVIVKEKDWLDLNDGYENKINAKGQRDMSKWEPKSDYVFGQKSDSDASILIIQF